VSTAYGDALFDLALEEDRIDLFHEEILGVRKVFEDNGELLRILNHPKITKEEKLSVIDRIFSGRISEEVTGFLRVIVTKDRYREIPAILAHFIHKVREYKGIGTAYVTSCVPLSGEQKEELTDKLLKVTRYNTFDVNYKVDPSILGGMIIRIGDRIVDSSLKTQLDRVTRQLVQIQL